MIEIKMLTKENGLDDYCRTQIVKRQYRMMDNEYILVEEKWVMDWDRQKKCEVAKSLISDNYIAFGVMRITVCKGVTIGAGSVIGAGGVVNKGILRRDR